MSMTLTSVVALLAVWMLACGWTGFHQRMMRFSALLLVGLGVGLLGIVGLLRVHPLDPNAMMALASLVLFGVSAFGMGWLAGRLARQWKASRVNDGV